MTSPLSYDRLRDAYLASGGSLEVASALSEFGAVISAKIAAEAIEPLLTRIADLEGENARLTKAQEVVAAKVSHYRARNNRLVSIQADDGEKCWIIHSDAIFALEQALEAALRALSGTDTGEPAHLSQDTAS